eukprot:scaffold6474_cov139-Isochrysis_galbana.AAC.6
MDEVAHCHCMIHGCAIHGRVVCCRAGRCWGWRAAEAVALALGLGGAAGGVGARLKNHTPNR